MNLLSTLWQDIRFGLRLLRKNPGFAAVAVFTLALGVGATSAVFALVQGVLLTPPPYSRSDRMVLITPAKTDGKPYETGSTRQQWTEWRKEGKSFAAMAGYIWTFDYMVQSEGSEYFQGMEVTPDYFKVIGTKPFLGRAFLESEAMPKGDIAIILGYDFWQRQFKGDRNVLGKTIKITRAEPPLVIVGVMPPGVRFLPAANSSDFPNYDINARVDYWIPIAPERTDAAEWGVAARLCDGVTLAQAQAELTTLTARQGKADSKMTGLTARARPLTAELNRDGNQLLLPLMGAVILVFLIACGNVAGLLLARGLQRQPAYTVRCAMGAPRARLFRQVVTESLVLSLVGSTLGALLAAATVKMMKAVGGRAIPRLDMVTISWPVLICCLVAAVLAAMLAGLLPALRASQQDPANGVKGVGRTSSASRADRRLLGGVAVIQTAFTLALLVGAGLLIQTVEHLASVRPGYETQNILTMSVALPKQGPQVMYDFHSQSLAAVTALPGVKAAAYDWGLPLTGDKWFDQLVIDGQAEAANPSDIPVVAKRTVSSGYFSVFNIPILEGRNFRTEDNWVGWKDWSKPEPGEVPPVCIINQALAKKYFPNSNPLGQKLRIGPWRKRPCEIVGIAADTRTESLTQTADPEIYVSFFQCIPFTKHLIVRTAADPRTMIAAVRQAVRCVDPVVSIDHIRTFDQIRAESVASQTFAMRLLVGFSLAGSALALVGLYGVLSLSVGSSKREIAIRMAVGAQPRDVLGVILTEGMKLIIAGLALGTGVALVLARVLKALLFGVAPADPMTFAGVALLFTAVALLACCIPARRAARIDPMTALRYE